MKTFFKVFGKGVLGVVLSPFAVILLALYLVYTLGLYIYQAGKWVVIFFMGKDYNAKLPEEIEAEEKMTNKVYDPLTKSFKNKEDLEKERLAMQNNTTNTNTYYQQNVYMGQKQPTKQETDGLLDGFAKENNGPGLPNKPQELDYTQEINQIEHKEDK